MRVAVLAGGRGTRMGGAKATASLAGEPLIAHVLRAAAAFEPVVVTKRDTPLPPLDVPVWIEPDEPSHPLTGQVTALERGPCVAVACDQPWLTSELLAELAQARAWRAVARRRPPATYRAATRRGPPAPRPAVARRRPPATHRGEAGRERRA